MGNGVGIAVGSWVADGTLPTLPEKTCALASSVASTARSWAIIASTVASMLGVGSATFRPVALPLRPSPQPTSNTNDRSVINTDDLKSILSLMHGLLSF